MANLSSITDSVSKADYQINLTKLYDRTCELIQRSEASILGSGRKL
jgi:hypothetical protein